MKRLTSLRTQYRWLIKPQQSGSGYVAKTAHQKWLVDKLTYTYTPVAIYLRVMASRSPMISVEFDF